MCIYIFLFLNAAFFKEKSNIAPNVYKWLQGAHTNLKSADLSACERGLGRCVNLSPLPTTSEISARPVVWGWKPLPWSFPRSDPGGVRAPPRGSPTWSCKLYHVRSTPILSHLGSLARYLAWFGRFGPPKWVPKWSQKLKKSLPKSI